MGCCCSVPRSLVSKQKIRLKDDTPSGTVDLDLTVIDKHIVCMGFPAEGVESWYRNPYDEVVKYLDHRFGEHYMVYNLCSEPQHVYPPEKFHGRVAHFPFPDHHACPLEVLPKFIEHATAFIAGDERRVVVVHCKAGKGRTGLFACCLLMKLVARLADPDAAMAYYGTARTHNGKGLTIPTQRRYVDYYGRLCRMSNGILPQHIPVIDLKTITLRGVLDKAPMAALEVITKSETTLIYIEEGHDTVPIGRTRHGNDLVLDVSHVPAFSRLAGDIRINGKADPTSKGWVAALSIHTLFMKKGYTASEIDKLYKKDLPQDAGMYFDYLEVMPTADHV
ncbi:tyrosine phosphatase, putative [Bodo saltans]|uniref:phosphatidylinositol-3,4,5-trisphosphate 3-phosphatase n=1 Tax=Bodo saltans TaxID=75058 RepID=A0A0S4JDL1_BODSA|nr:tyrosine phosphatase, putative [Bodo saltans]|eukprot:CUG89452.1 tyrosine phosphatase, putative [Bodo saltans]